MPHCAPKWLAGTTRQYSSRAMPQLIRIICHNGSGAAAGLMCQYHANVMMRLDRASRAMTMRICIGMCFHRSRKGKWCEHTMPCGCRKQKMQTARKQPALCFADLFCSGSACRSGSGRLGLCLSLLEFFQLGFLCSLHLLYHFGTFAFAYGIDFNVEH